MLGFKVKVKADHRRKKRGDQIPPPLLSCDQMKHRTHMLPTKDQHAIAANSSMMVSIFI